MTSTQDTLLVVAKRPTAGQTKTRLCPPFTPVQAAALYECFLRDTLDLMRRVPGVQRTIAYLPEDALSYFHELAPDMALIGQRGASLGERLDNLLTDTLAAGAPRVVVMNSDSPTLPPEYLAQSFTLLADADVVIGPTHDGGYYLIGLKEPQPHLFRQVQMSTPRTLADTLALAEASRVTVSLLPAWYDVDTIDELNQLDVEISGNRNGLAPATQRWLSSTDWRHGQAGNT